MNKTPKAQTYARLESFVGYGWDKIFDNVVSKLDSLDYSEAHEVIVSRAGDHALTDPGIPSLDAGVILIGSHGSSNTIAVEFYTDPDVRHVRFNSLLNGGQYQSNEIIEKEVDTHSHGTFYTIDLTLDGIARIANGHDGLALVAACSAASVHSSLGSRVTLGYAGDVYADVARADFEGVMDVLASMTFGSRSVDVAKAANADLTMEPESGAGNLVLTPIYDPSSVCLQDSLDNTQCVTDETINWSNLQLTMQFDSWMNEDDSWFTVAGVSLDGVSESEGLVTLQMTNGRTGVIAVSTNAANVTSDQGAHLAARDSYSYAWTSSSENYAASIQKLRPRDLGNGVQVSWDVLMYRDTKRLWLERRDGDSGYQATGFSVDVDEDTPSRFSLFDPLGGGSSIYRVAEEENSGRILYHGAEPVLSGNLPTDGSEERLERVPALSVASSSRKQGLKKNGKVMVHTALPDGAPLKRCEASATEDAEKTGILHHLAVLVPEEFQSAILPYVYHWDDRPDTDVHVFLHSSSTSTTADDIQDEINFLYSEWGVRDFVLVGAANDWRWRDDAARWPDVPGVSNDWARWYGKYHDPQDPFYSPSHPEWDFTPTNYIADTELDNRSYYTPYSSSDLKYVWNLSGAVISRIPCWTTGEASLWAQRLVNFLQQPSRAEDGSVDLLVYAANHASGSEGYCIAQTNEHILPALQATGLSLHQTWYTHDNVLSAQERADAFQAALDRSGLVFLYGTNSSPESMVFYGNELWDPATSADDGNFTLVMSPICATGWDDMSLKASSGLGVMRRISQGPVTGGVMGIAGPSYGQWGSETGMIGAAMIDALHQNGSRGWVRACEEQLKSMDQANPDLLDAIQSFVFYGDPLAPYAGAVQPTSAPTPLVAVAPRVVPNPFNPSAEIRFTLARKAQVMVRVYDTRGRVIARPWEGEMEAGPRSVRWNGMDDARKPVASGIYYARVKIGDQVSRRKLALIK